MYLINFQANVTSSVIQCYTDLVKQITVAIHHEEERCQYLSSQAKIMLAVHDEVAAMPEGKGTCHLRVQKYICLIMIVSLDYRVNQLRLKKNDLEFLELNKK